MHSTEGSCAQVIELVGDDYFPSKVDEAEIEQQQQQRNGSAAGNGGEPAQLDLALPSWRDLEGYIYSDAAVMDLQSRTRIPTPSVTLRRRFWRLVNCMRGQNPPMAITITDLLSPVKPANKSPSVAPQGGPVSSATDHQAAKVPLHASSPASPLASPSTPSSSTASVSIPTTSAPQHSSSREAASEKTNVAADESLREARVFAGGNAKPEGSHTPVVGSGAAGARNTTRWRLLNAPYLARGFTSDVFPPECRQLLEELPMGAQMEDWSVFVVAATLSFYQRQAHAWASSWWAWSYELTDSGGHRLTGWLTASSVSAAVDEGVLSIAGRVVNASASTTTATAAASAATSLLVSVLYALRILLLCILCALRGLLRSAHFLVLKASNTQPAKDSIMWTLATNPLWLRQVELVLASIAFILLVMCALVLMRYHKYSRTLSLWEAEMLRRDAAEVAKWASEMSAQQQRLCIPTSAAVSAGGSLRVSESLVGELRTEMRRGAPGSFANCQDGAFWYVNAKGEANEDAASSFFSPCWLCESSDSGPADALMADFSRERLQQPSRDCGAAAAAAGGVRSLGGGAAMPAKGSPSVSSLQKSLLLPLASSGQLTRVSGSAWSRNDGSTAHAQRARSLPVTPALTSPSASDGLGSRTLSWMAAVPLRLSVGRSSSTAKPRRVEAAPRKRRLSAGAEQVSLIPSLYCASAVVDQGASAGDDLSLITETSPAFIRDASPGRVDAVTGCAVGRGPQTKKNARAKDDIIVVRDKR